MKKILSAAQLLLLLQIVYAVKIGISRKNLDITSTTTTTTTTEMPPSSADPTTEFDLLESIATTDMTEMETEHTSPTTTTTLKSTTTTTKKPNFTISIFPPRLRTTKSPKITTTSSTPPTVASTTATSKTESSSEAPNDDIHSNGAHSSPSVYYCNCDLLLDTCDINCCCDRDCREEALNVFNCNNPPMQKKLKNRLDDFQYQHGLQSCKVNDGWLCVFRTNPRKERHEVSTFYIS